jgi:very-short-patch-repair endonuclease
MGSIRPAAYAAAAAWVAGGRGGESVGIWWDGDGMDTHLALAEVLRRQHHVITRRQALECGLGHDTIHRWALSGGPWQRLLPGVYLAVTGTPTINQKDMAALLYGGPGATLTGPSALRRHGMRIQQPEMIDVLIPASRPRQSSGFVRLRQTRRLPPQVCYEGPVQYALAARAVADAARDMQELAAVRAVVAAAVQTRRCTVEQIEAELRAGPVHGSALLRTALAEVAQGTRSAPEADLFELIKKGGLPEPLFNPRLFVGQEFLASPDAWWPDYAIAVEVDSREWHLSPESWEKTMRRHARMTARGILVLHFSPRQIRQEADEVLTEIRIALGARRGLSVLGIRTIAAA